MISNDFADAINGVHVSSTFIFQPKFAFWDNKNSGFVIFAIPPKTHPDRPLWDAFSILLSTSAAAIGSDPWLAPDRPRSGPEIGRQAGPSLDQIGIWRCRHTACSVQCSLPHPRLADACKQSDAAILGVRRCWRSL